MYYTPYVAVVAVAIGISTASPATLKSSDVKGKKTITIEQVLNNNATLFTPQQRLLQTYQKYTKSGAKAPKAVIKAAETASVVATPEDYDVSYLCPVTVGGKTLNLNFDTGSADLWVYSTLQPSQERSGHAFYNTRSGKLRSGYSWDIEYGDGSGASGKVYADKVAVGAVTATSQAIGAATSVSSSFLSDTANDGMLGLAFSFINTISPTPQTTFFDTVKAQLARPLFTVALKKAAPGTFDFGYIDEDKYSGSINYVDVDTESGFWQVPASGYSIGNGAKINRSFSCVVDTGTSLMLLPPAVVKAYYKSVKGAMYSDYQGGWVLPCNANLPALNIVLGGKKAKVPGAHLNYAPVGDDLCFGGLQMNDGLGFSILGDVFLKSQFVVFKNDGSDVQVGFAVQT